VFACTLSSFGPSKKAPQVDTTAVWKAYVQDYAINVIQEPAVVAGNSIGGAIPANARADYPQSFKGLVLINTAGSTDLDCKPGRAVGGSLGFV
jgi:pimeloyl-ACP methyl ester carboxylesterase